MRKDLILPSFSYSSPEGQGREVFTALLSFTNKYKILKRVQDNQQTDPKDFWFESESVTLTNLMLKHKGCEDPQKTISFS